MSEASETEAWKIAVVVGNPKLSSRTRDIGVAVAQACGAHLGAHPVDVVVVELGELASSLFAWGDPGVAAAKQQVLDSDMIVVASPVYKASFTGLLKAFLDQFGQDELGARAVVPLMVGAGPAHSLAVETQLRPVLVEIGASCPTRGLYVLDTQVGELAEPLAAWLNVWGDVLKAVVACRRPG
jgi:FMN reductase